MNAFKSSDKLYKEALKYLVGGVNSPVRSFKSVNRNPLFIKAARGSKITDADGNSYIDYVGAYGPAILGHADGCAVQAISEVLNNGFAFGANSALETKLAKLILKAYPFHEKIRFVNSGTEAVMSAVRLARGVTGRSKILKFAGCYHGHMDDLLAAGGSGVATLSLPNSAGVTRESVQNTIVVPYNNIDAVDKALRTYKNQIAAVIIEPVAGNMGLVLPQEHFLLNLKEICKKNGTLLISDEVMCGFRKSFNSVMSSFGAEPDITCLGKIIGGGLPVGAYTARSHIMDQLAPLGPVYQAGTLSGNPVVMACGIATLEKVNKQNFYKELNAHTKNLVRIIEGSGLAASQFGSMFHFFFSNLPPQNYEEVQTTELEKFNYFFNQVIKKGLFIPPSPYETWFVSAAHDDQDIEKTKKIISSVLKSIL